MFIRFEYDLAYTGGNYSGVGQIVLVPADLCRKVGEREAFRQHTNIDPIHIVHYSNELYNENGDVCSEEEYVSWLAK